MGASGDLATKKTFPALFNIFKHEYMPPNTKILGYARSNMDQQKFEKQVSQNIKSEKGKVEKFLKMCEYVKGQYDVDADFQNLNAKVLEHENKVGVDKSKTNRMFYLALPPSVYADVTKMIKNNAYLEGGINKLVIEKPFGKDTDSCKELLDNIGSLFKEEEVPFSINSSCLE